jgi:hypothetical protein
MLENLKPAPKVTAPANFRPGVEFDGTEGTATTPGYESEPQNFDEFLIDAGLNPEEIDIIPPVRTSRWQQREGGEWLTSYRFTFRRKTAGIDLPLLMAEAKKKVKAPKVTSTQEKALVVLWSDLQVGKVDYRGNSQSLIDRVALMQTRLLDLVKRERPEQIIFADLGDTIESFYNAADLQQLATNDLSLMEQVDLATTFAWETLRLLYERVPNITYASVGSNHCQFRIGKQVIGKATDDWGVFIGRQLARLAKEKELNIRFLEPQEHDESLALDVFDDGFHILGVVHGHQARRPDQMATWWRGQAFGRQPVADASVLVHGHWHHLRVTEMGSTPRGTSRFLVMAPTMDNGSGWWKKVTGEDSVPGLATFTLEKGVDFTGTVYKL